MAYDWTQLTNELITKLFLYGQNVKPSNLVSDQLIRPVDDINTKDDNLHVEVEMGSFMSSGPGRFALGSKSGLVAAFMTGLPTVGETLGTRYEFTADQLYDALLSNGVKVDGMVLDPRVGNRDRFTISQIYYDDGASDVGTRTFIYDTGLFRISNDARFVIDANGTRHIENFAVHAMQDDFDFEGAGIVGYLDPIAKAQIDPSGIGRKVFIDFINKQDVPVQNYSATNYYANVLQNSLNFEPISAISLSLTEAEITALNLFSSGEKITRFLDENNRPIFYGSDNSDSLSADFSVKKAPLLHGFIASGVVLIGGKGNDRLTGGTHADKLLGGADNDVLDGRSGNDTMDGGAGTDNFVWTAGDTDTIIDSAGRATGRIFFRNSAGELESLAGGFIKSTGASTWQKILGDGTEITLSNSSGWKVTASGSTLILPPEFADGDYGISLTDNTITDPLTSRDILGDLTPIDFDPGTAGIQTQNDELGNVKTTSTPEPNRADTLRDSAGNDHIMSGGGDDRIYLNQGGSDWVQGGDGSDMVDGSAANARLLEGNAGADILIGSSTADTIYAADKINLADAISQGATQTGSSTKGDWLGGAGGDDTLIGTNTADLLLGGADDDIMVGGGGDDTFYGDGQGSSIFRDWSITREVIRYSDHNLYQVHFNQASITNTVSGDDTIYGGAGNDWIFSGAGNDVADGGNNNDVLFGENGNDLLDGGTGNDVVAGGNGDDYVIGGEGNDSLSGADYDTQNELGNDTLDGGNGNDNLSGNAGDDLLLAGAGNDNLFGGAGNDQLDGGIGDDYINGGAGNDVYRIGAQEGMDSLDDASGQDTLTLGATWDSVTVSVQGTNLFLHFSDANNYVGIINGSSGAIDSFEFSDKTLKLAEVLKRIKPENYNEVTGTEANLVLGTAGALSNMTNTGTTSTSNTTYQIQNAVLTNVSDSGGGADTVDFGLEVNSTQATYTRLTNDDLLIKLDTGAEVTIKQHFVAGNAHKIESIQFADTTVSTASLDSLVSSVAEASQGDDILLGTAVDDELYGWTGDDTLQGGIGNDLYYFAKGDGVDTILDSDVVVGNSDALLFIDIQSIDITVRKIGLDLVLKSGTDQVTVQSFFAGVVNEVEQFHFSDGVIWNVSDIFSRVTLTTNGGSGIDNLQGAFDAPNIINGLDGNDNIVGGSLADTLDGGNGDDTLYGRDGGDVLNGGVGNDVMHGENGNDVLSGAANNDYLAGGSGDDTLQGGDGNDIIYGEDGNDIVTGGLGNDTLYAGAGTNIYTFARGDGQDNITNNNASTVHHDTLSFAAGILITDVTLVRVQDNLEVRINSSTDKIVVINHFVGSPLSRILFSGGTEWLESSFDSRLSIVPTSGDDELGGREGADVISGGAGNDNIYGNNGSDTLNGGDGQDGLSGGDGNDNLNGDEGQDLLLGGEGNDTLNGGNGLDSLYGGNGNDTLDGGALNDLLSGDSGNDSYTYNIGSGVDTIYEVADQASVDKVLFGAGITTANITYSKVGSDLQFRMNVSDYLIVKNFFQTLDSQFKVEQFVFNGGPTWTSEQIQALLTTPTNGNDTISGYEVADNINGLDGSDRLYGNGGNDTLLGAFGNDTLDGGIGNDSLDGGVDNDSITGGDGSDTLIGGGGNDILAGGAGDDIYQYQRGDGLDNISDSAGIDTILLASGIVPTDVTLLRDYNNLYLVLNNTEISIQMFNTQIENIQFAGGTTWNAAEIQSRTVYGSLSTLTGTAGNDSFTVDNNGDTITEAANQGTDTVTSSVSYTLGNNVENLTLTGILNLDGYGNLLNNLIIGNNGNNIIDGGVYSTGYSNDGQDTLIGGAGDDTYYASAAGGDVVTELADQGNDTVISTFSYTLSDNVENLTIQGNYIGSVTATGNALNNLIRARSNTYGDFIDGGLGADIMIGAYDTTFYVDNVGDSISGAGTITVLSTISYTLQEYNLNLSSLTLLGSDSIKATGNSGANIIDGRQNVAANILEGGAGDDTYIAGANDAIVEQANGGNDTLSIYVDNPYVTYLYQASANIENLIVSTNNYYAVNLEGSGDNNYLQGNNGTNHISGLGGNDTIDGGSGGFDTLDGGDGNDTISGTGYLYGGAGNDALSGTGSFSGDVGDDTLSGSSLDNYIYSRGDGADTIYDYTLYDPATAANPASYYVDRIDFVGGLSGNEIMLSQIGEDLKVSINGTTEGVLIKQHFAAASGNISSAIEQMTFENGTIWDDVAINNRIARNNQNIVSELADVLSGTLNNDMLLGLNGDDLISGDTGDDAIDGGIGNDTLFGNSGIDTLIGGLGDDVLRGGIGEDVYRFGRGAGLDTIIDIKNNAEIDTILIDADLNPLDIVVRASGLYNLDLTLSIKGEFSQVTIRNFYVTDATSGANKQVEFADGTIWDTFALRELATSYFGSSVNDSLVGSEAADKLYGLEGDDIIEALDGSDILDGGSGSDSMAGGLGSDTYIVDNLGDLVTESFDEGYDSVQSSVSYILTDEVENLILTGTNTINGTGNSLSNLIQGNEANNILNGGAGTDNLEGGLGDDTYLVDVTGDYVFEDVDAGTDTVESAATYTLAANIENLTLTGAVAINGTGNAANNNILGNSANNTLTGNDGDDTLDGGLGTDILKGGQGNDTYIVNVTSETVTELTNQGTDTVFSSATFTLSSYVENLTLTGTAAINGTGNTLANTLIGNSAANTLDGGSGIDTMSGGVGNDIYKIDSLSDSVIENAGEGTDRIDSAITYSLASINHVENLTLTGTSVANATGNDLANALVGNTAANILDGGLGADNMTGGTGNDTYVVDNVLDLVAETSTVATEIDQVNASVSFTLGANIEKLTLTGAANIDATGNGLANTLTGNAGNNILNGAAGADTMAGGAGDDTYKVDNALDSISEASNAGNDSVESSVTYTLASNVENILLTGTSAINATGNTLANTLTGNSAANLIDGGTGADTMIGKAGNDTYTVDNINDVVTEITGEGTDLVNVNIGTTGGTYTVAAFVEKATITSTVAYNLTGNDLANTLTGNAANNILDGATGVDSLVGGAGNDTYIVDLTVTNALQDTITEAASGGVDTVVLRGGTVLGTAATITLGTEIDKLDASSTGTILLNITGNTLANTITGNAANNLINGGTGNDTMIGGLGDDTYVLDVTTDVVTEASGGGTDTIQSAITLSLVNFANVENLTLTGTTAIDGTGNALNNYLTGNDGINSLIGNDGNDTLDGGLSADSMTGGLGNDTYVVDNTGDTVVEGSNAGTDTVQVKISTASGTHTLAANVENGILKNTVAFSLSGNSLSNFLTGNAAVNTLSDTIGGNDIYQGMAGADILNDSLGNNLFDGGLDNDSITGGSGNDLIIGGKGNDTITAGSGYDVISFNKGDGLDTINISTDTASLNTLSLGGAFAYSDLSLTKTGNNLILKMGTTDQITFKDWYAAGATNKSIANLQVIAEAVTGFTQGSTDAAKAALNDKVENFNFTNLVAEFDAAGATANWTLSDSLIKNYIATTGGSQTQAIGGDLAYQYGRNSNLTGIGLIAAQSVINTSTFGQNAQTFSTTMPGQSEAIKLG